MLYGYINAIALNLNKVPTKKLCTRNIIHVFLRLFCLHENNLDEILIKNFFT